MRDAEAAITGGVASADVRIAIVMPYYQREPGILARALQSIFWQDIRGAQLSIIVVDDSSPLDPAIDIASAGSPPAQTTIQVVRRANGGPGAARNTGLAATPAEADYIALLDSDDTWRPSHLSRALAALCLGSDVYFSDHDATPGAPHLPSTQLVSRLNRGDQAVHPIEGQLRVFSCAGSWLAELAANEYLGHTSTLVFSAPGLGHVRFNEVLREAGEDHLFVVDLLLAARRACFSLDSDMDLGKGVNIYASAQQWGEDSDLRRRAYNLGSGKQMLNRSKWAPEVRKALRRRLANDRRTVGFLFVRRLLRERALGSTTTSLIWRQDPMTLLLAPLNAIAFALDRKASRPDAEVVT